MPVPDFQDGVAPSISELVEWITNQVISQVTAATNPSGTGGQAIYETDTRRLKLYDDLDGFRDIGATGAWRTWTPSWDGATTDPVLGNGTALGQYYLMGTLGFFLFRWIFGASGASFGSGEWRLTLPAGIEADNAVQWEPLGIAWVHDANAAANDTLLVPLISTTDTTLIRWRPHEATTSVLSPTVPFTFQASDQITGHFWLPLAYTP